MAGYDHKRWRRGPGLTARRHAAARIVWISAHRSRYRSGYCANPQCPGPVPLGRTRNPYFFRWLLALVLVQMKPFGPKYFASPDGTVPCGALTTAYRRRLKVEVKAELITVEPPVPVVGAVPLMLLRTMVPWVLQPNTFCPP